MNKPNHINSRQLLLLLIACLGGISSAACTVTANTGYKPIPTYEMPKTFKERSGGDCITSCITKNEKTATSCTRKENCVSTFQKKAVCQTICSRPEKYNRTELRDKVHVAKEKSPKHKSLEMFVQKWLGTPYKYGGTSKKGIDCSGYVLRVYKRYYSFEVLHNAASIFDDPRGKEVKKTQLQEGDLVFFGDGNKISHIGIYLGENRFTHASTSQGVTITPLDDSYWQPKYKGARRFIK